MNIDHNLVARAFNKAGQEPLTDQEWTAKESTRYRIVNQFYLETILETLSNTDWTSQKKRVRLVEVFPYVAADPQPTAQNFGDGVYYEYENGNYIRAESYSEDKTYYVYQEKNLTTYMHMYVLPADIAKPVSLIEDEIFIVEGPYLYTNQSGAILTYITNGYTATEITGDDYPNYNSFTPDAMLAEYIETRLASKIVLKLSGDTQLYQLLYNEAMLMENRAVKASSAQGQNKDKGNPYWYETLGLPDEQEI